MFKKPNLEKAKKLEKKGDQHREKKEYKKAMKAYRDALEANSENSSIYEKLLEMQSALELDWDEKDFLETMDWTMKKQELENPQIKNLHESLTGEYQKIKRLIAQMIGSPPDQRDRLIQQIKEFKEKAVLPLLDTLLA